MIDIYIIKFVSIGIYTRECQPFPFLLLGFQNSISLERENTKILIYTNSVSILEFFSIMILKFYQCQEVAFQFTIQYFMNAE